MTDKTSIDLGNVQKTLLLPLWGRAQETGKKHPMLVDETAVRILQQIDFDFAPLARNLDELSQIAWIKRSLFCDRTVRKFLANCPDGTVVNIGCGLDTTFERIDNGQVRWYDLDLPDTIALRARFIQESERRRFIASSFLEPDWLKSLQVEGNVLFIAAGVFYYFQEEEIKGFLLRLLESFAGCELLCDVCSPLGVRVANKKVVESAGLDERSHLTWGLKNKKDLLAWDSRIRLLETLHYFGDLRFSPRNLLMGAFSDLMGIQYMLHLRLGDRPR
jgi:O-methyltransferase involved in polyketide biosynthesis